MGVYIIAEAGVNHNGDYATALQLCDAALRAGVDAVKFQTWKTENLVTGSAEMASYQKENTGGADQTQFTMLKKLELTYEEFSRIKAYCDRIGLKFLSTPDEEESLEFLSTLGLDFIKVGSGEVTNIPYLKKIGSKKQRIVLSTGMSNLGDVEKAYFTLLEAGAPRVDLLHCTTNYPCPMDEVNLRAMLTLRDAFKCDVGYSDHTVGIEVPVAAVAMGASIIEKHFTLDKSMEGPDHKASLDPAELKAMVAAIRNIEKALGDGVKRPNRSETEISGVVRKSIVARRPIPKGATITEEDIVMKRCSGGMAVEQWENVVGSTAARDFEYDEPVSFI